MKLSDFLDVAEDDDMVEVYADDGATRPCETKLVDAFQVSDWVGGILDVCDEVAVYEDREVTGVATVKLDGCGDDAVVAMRVYVEQEEGDEDVRNQGVRNMEEVQVESGVPEVPDGLDRGDGRSRKGQGGGRAVEPGGGDQHDGHGHGQVKKVVGVLVHEHSVPELVIREIPEGRGRPANLVVLPGIEAPDTDELGGDDAIGFELASRVVAAIRKGDDVAKYSGRRNTMVCQLCDAADMLDDLRSKWDEEGGCELRPTTARALINDIMQRVTTVVAMLDAKWEG